jgi:hypothetical protein
MAQSVAETELPLRARFEHCITVPDLRYDALRHSHTAPHKSVVSYIAGRTPRSPRRRTMRTILILASAALTSAAFTAPAAAEGPLHLTPPLYREQARATQQVRPAHELMTVPRPVAAPAPGDRTASLTDRPLIQASVAAMR